MVLFEVRVMAISTIRSNASVFTPYVPAMNAPSDKSKYEIRNDKILHQIDLNFQKIELFTHITDSDIYEKNRSIAYSTWNAK